MKRPSPDPLENPRDAATLARFDRWLVESSQDAPTTVVDGILARIAAEPVPTRTAGWHRRFRWLPSGRGAGLRPRGSRRGDRWSRQGWVLPAWLLVPAAAAIVTLVLVDRDRHRSGPPAAPGRESVSVTPPSARPGGSPPGSTPRATAGEAAQANAPGIGHPAGEIDRQRSGPSDGFRGQASSSGGHSQPGDFAGAEATPRNEEAPGGDDHAAVTTNTGMADSLATFAAATGDSLVTYRFHLDALPARQVCLVGSFNAWSICRTPLVAESDGSWSVTVALERGRYEYMFVVDGQWLTDPNASQMVDDGFGNKNAVLLL